jgi:hypothetical protein
MWDRNITDWFPQGELLFSNDGCNEFGNFFLVLF